MRSVAFALLSMGAAALPPAEIRGGESIEWLVYDSDIIVSGSVHASKTVEGPRGYKFAQVTLKISEAFKGKVGAEIEFLVQDWQRVPSRCRGGEVEMLVFLVESKRYEESYGGKLPSTWALRGLEQGVIPLDDKPEMGIFDTDFREHLKRADILASTRQAVRAMQKEKPKPVRVEPPWDSGVQKRLYSGSTVYLVVPADGNVEKKATAWVRSQDMQQRVDAVRILEHLKSTGNVELLKPLLADPGFLTVTEANDSKRKRYRVREEAYRVLTAWKVDVKKPVVEEPGER